MRSILISITLLLCVSLHHICLAQEEQIVAEDFDSEGAKAKRLAYVTGHAKALKGTRDKDEEPITPMDKPLLRWTNPYSNVRDGFLVGWVDKRGVPMAVAQIYLLPNREDVWGIETQSLSQNAFELSSKTNGPWRPRQPGVEWRAFPGKTDTPAHSKPLRLSQMRALARRFRGNDDFEQEDSVLRLLTNPVIRYEDPESGLVDGALFALVHGTDPEMMIQIELREDKKTTQRGYFYALSPMTGYELRGYLDGKEVWHKPRMQSNRDTDVFWQRNVSDSVVSTNLLRRLFNF